MLGASSFESGPEAAGNHLGRPLLQPIHVALPAAIALLIRASEGGPLGVGPCSH